MRKQSFEIIEDNDKFIKIYEEYDMYLFSLTFNKAGMFLLMKR